MTEKTGILRRMIECGVVAVARSDDPSQLVLAAEALKEGGVDVFEVTMSVPGALQVIRDMSQRFASEIIVGAGAIWMVRRRRRLSCRARGLLLAPA